MAQYWIVEEWLTNCWEQEVAKACQELTDGPSKPYEGAPKATDSRSVEELRAMGVVGIYRVVKVDHDPRKEVNDA